MVRISAIGVLAFALTGCGTAKNFTDGYKSETKPYGGVKIAVDRFKGDDLAEVGIMFPFWTIDLGLTAVGDTLTLPAAVAAEIVRGINDYYFAKENPPPETVPAP